MDTKTNMKDLTVNELITEFESSIVFSTFGTKLSYKFSTARQELLRRGSVSLSGIVQHFRNKVPDREFDLDGAWIEFFQSIYTKIDQEKTGQNKFNNMDDCLKWAEKFV